MSEKAAVILVLMIYIIGTLMWAHRRYRDGFRDGQTYGAAAEARGRLAACRECRVNQHADWKRAIALTLAQEDQLGEAITGTDTQEEE